MLHQHSEFNLLASATFSSVGGSCLTPEAPVIIEYKYKRNKIRNNPPPFTQRCIWNKLVQRRAKPVVRETHDAETESETIEENNVINCVECSTEVERDRRVASPLSAAWYRWQIESRRCTREVSVE